MADAHRRRFDAVLCWKFDGFARSGSHLLRALESFRASGIDFNSFSEQLEPAHRLSSCLDDMLTIGRLASGGFDSVLCPGGGSTAAPGMGVRGFQKQDVVSYAAMSRNKSEALTSIGLFAGIGGIELGLCRAGYRM